MQKWSISCAVSDEVNVKGKGLFSGLKIQVVLREGLVASH